MFSQMLIIKPGTGISPNIILSEDIFPVLHRLFVEHDKKFGITFPAYSFDGKGQLGNILEVLSEDREALTSLHLEEQLSSLSDYVKVKKKLPPQMIMCYSNAFAKKTDMKTLPAACKNVAMPNQTDG